MARAVGAVSRLLGKFCFSLGCRRLRRVHVVPFAGCTRRYLFPTAHTLHACAARRAASETMPGAGDLSPARLACEPRPACASSASHAGGFAAGSLAGRASYSDAVPERVCSEPQDCVGLDVEAAPRVVEFPADIFGCADVMQALGDMRIFAFLALLPAIKRIAVRAVERAGCYGMYLLDYDGGEHPFVDFTSAASATYAAMRIAQAYRLPVEFGSFAEPKAWEGRCGPWLSGARGRRMRLVTDVC